MKLISVIIPVHNVEKYIKNCLISVFDQTYKNIEVILINDFSTDKTVKIAKSFQKSHLNLRIINLKNYGYKKNSGISAARNLGIKFLVNISWVIVFLIPWIWRRIRGKSSGDGRMAKYSEPVKWLSR